MKRRYEIQAFAYFCVAFLAFAIFGALSDEALYRPVTAGLIGMVASFACALAIYQIGHIDGENDTKEPSRGATRDGSENTKI
ncbi:hypothetical protein I6E29_00915 [Arcanobacterium haemolyticum]|nr:hypothetical protein [Arcanobacterium haemolyticum]